MQFKYRIQAREHEEFAENAFDSQIGKLVPVNFRETESGPVIAPLGEARLVGVAILEEGKVAELTLETSQDGFDFMSGVVDGLTRGNGGMSFSAR